MPERSLTVRLEELVRDAVQEQLYVVRVAMPAMITEYDNTTQFASVQPLIKHGYTNEQGDRIAETLPIIHDVPVHMFGGFGGNARITCPVQKGDVCLMVCSSSAIDRWLQRAGAAITDPIDDRRHDINDAIAYVGLHNYKTVPTTAPLDALVLHAYNGILIRLGSPDAAGDVVVQSALDDFGTALGTAIIALGANPAAAALTALQTALGALNTGAGWKAGTTKTKAE
jgi:hypothetical protein